MDHDYKLSDRERDVMVAALHTRRDYLQARLTCTPMPGKTVDPRRTTAEVDEVTRLMIRLAAIDYEVA